MISVVIPNWNGRRWLPGCLAALAAQERAPDEIIVVDNGSSDGSVEYLRHEHPDVTVLALSRNTGFAAAANIGVSVPAGEFMALVNADVELAPDWLARMAATLEAHPGAASVACKMLSLRDPTIVDDAGDVLRRDGVCEQRGRFGPDDGRWDTPGEVFGACAGAALYRRSAVVKASGFHEPYFAYLEDVDLALRAAPGRVDVPLRARGRAPRRPGLVGCAAGGRGVPGHAQHARPGGAVLACAMAGIGGLPAARVGVACGARAPAAGSSARRGRGGPDAPGGAACAPGAACRLRRALSKTSFPLVRGGALADVNDGPRKGSRRVARRSWNGGWGGFWSDFRHYPPQPDDRRLRSWLLSPPFDPATSPRKRRSPTATVRTRYATEPAAARTARASRTRLVLSSATLRSRTALGVTSTHSSARRNSSAWSSDSSRLGTRRTSSSAVEEAHVGQVLLLAGVDVEVLGPGVLAHDHALVDLVAGSHEQDAALLQVEQRERGHGPAPVGDQGAGGPRAQVPVPRLPAIEHVVEEAGPRVSVRNSVRKPTARGSGRLDARPAAPG